jgi:hypothetical protein
MDMEHSLSIEKSAAKCNRLLRKMEQAMEEGQGKRTIFLLQQEKNDNEKGI